MIKRLQFRADQKVFLIHFEVKQSSIYNEGVFIPRVHAIGNYLNNRYSLDAKKLSHKLGYVNDQFVRNRMTLRIVFHL